MKRLSILFCSFFIAVASCYGQQLPAPKIEKVFLDQTDTTRTNYTLIYPKERSWKGYVCLIPGFGETAERVMQQTDLPVKLAQSGLLTIIPTLQDGVLSFGVDASSQHTLTEIINDVIAKHKLSDLKLYVGGFSIGGSCAIKYAENAGIKPSAVFTIDPPLDFERFYHSAKRDVRLSKENQANPENVYMIERIEKETGGTPATHLAAYYALSPYSFSDTTQAAVKKLINMPLRIYTEPDINWWMRERSADFTTMNATEGSAFINELNRLGNTNAALITTTNKGYRKPNNVRHPHAWSIVDQEELIVWLLKQK